MSDLTPITVAYGNGIGPEIMEATLKIIKAAGAKLDIETIVIGEEVYLRGNNAGIEPSSWDSLRRTKVFLKSPVTTPQGGGFKSMNVTIRKTLGLFANVRPCISYYPYIETKHTSMNMVIIRENEEDLYGGIEHRQTIEVYQCLKLITRPGSEKIIRYAFEFARNNNRKKISCFVKDNIMKMTDGLFHKLFDEIGEEYPEIEKEVLIVDIGAARMATSPEIFDVIVLQNLYGDILSDVAAMMTGSLGLAGSSNIGDNFAMFEAIHGSAKDLAGKNEANPSGLLLGAVLMLNHIKQYDVATNVHNALLKTIEDGIHTCDIYREGTSKQKVGTREYADAIIARLGQKPETLKPVLYNEKIITIKEKPEPKSKIKFVKELVGVDLFIDWNNGTPNDLGDMLKRIQTANLKLEMISNRGTKVYPNGFPETFCTDHWRCRYIKKNKTDRIKHPEIIELLEKVYDHGFDFIKMELLYYFNGEAGFTKAQGQ
ncbi:MAG: NADP-dependent isocitrate dehydrogenase [Ignavibacteria bacterium]|nr:NADP-dependent isocitrate dehydrogenase [Ignavibacteria bacterium]